MTLICIASSEVLQLRVAAGANVSHISHWGDVKHLIGCQLTSQWPCFGCCTAAFDASATGVGGSNEGPVTVAWAGAKSQCDATPRRTLAKLGRAVMENAFVSVTRLLASLNEMFPLIFSIKISFSFFRDGHVLE